MEEKRFCHPMECEALAQDDSIILADPVLRLRRPQDDGVAHSTVTDFAKFLG